MSSITDEERKNQLKKRDNTTPSCRTCQLRRVKCSREFPCHACVNSKRQCHFVQRVRKERKTAMTTDAAKKAITRSSQTENLKMEHVELKSESNLMRAASTTKLHITAAFTAEGIRRPCNPRPLENGSPFSVNRHIREHHELRTRKRLFYGGKPHNAVLVGMSDGDWPEFSQTIP